MSSGGLQPTQAQTNLSIRAVFIPFMEGILCKLASGEVSIS